MKQGDLKIGPESKRKEILYIERAVAFETDSGINILAFKAGLTKSFARNYAQFKNCVLATLQTKPSSRVGGVSHAWYLARP